MLTLEQLMERCPDYASDLKLNLGRALRQVELTEQQTWGTAVCSAIASRDSRVIETILGEASARLKPQALYAAKAAAAVMGMSNIFYRFRHLSSNPKYGRMPARLRMQVNHRHGADPVDYELWCVAVSAINGCGACVDAHEKALRQKGVGEEVILAAIRIASTIYALSAVMGAEAAIRTEARPPDPPAPLVAPAPTPRRPPLRST